MVGYSKSILLTVSGKPLTFLSQVLNTLNNARGGCKRDWNVNSHAGLIAELKSMITANPALTRTRLYLMDNLIEDGRYSEAEAILAETENVNTRIIYELWIKERREGFESTRTAYEELLNNDDQSWVIYADAADRLAYNMEYRLAINAYEKAHEIAPKPRYTDMLHSIIMLAELLEDYPLAAETCRRELDVLEEEWSITKGEQVDSIKDMIKKYSKA